MRPPPTRPPPPRWSWGRTVFTGTLAALVADLLAHAAHVPWWLAVLLGVAVGVPVGWYGVRPRPDEEP